MCYTPPGTKGKQTLAFVNKEEEYRDKEEETVKN